MKSILIACLLFFSTSINAVSPVSFPADERPPPGRFVTLTAFAKMKIKDAEKLAGRKFTVKEKIGFKLSQAKLKKELSRDTNPESSKKGKAAFVLSILSLAAIIFPFISIPLAVVSIILASKALKANEEDRKAKTAMTLAILSLGITVVAALIIGIFVSDGAFSIFIIK